MRMMNYMGRLRASFSLGVVCFGLLTKVLFSAAQSRPPQPDFGANVLIFAPSMTSAHIQASIDKVYASQQHSEFGSARYALLFLPGKYHVDIPVGFYTEVIGLGTTP